MTKSTKRHWTKEDDNLIREMYCSHTTQDMLPFFPGKNEDSITRRAFILGLKKPLEFMPAANTRNGNWTTAEKAVLIEQYPLGGAYAVQSKLPYRSIQSIRVKASNMKVLHNPKYRSNAIAYTDNILGNLNEAEKGYLAGIIDGEGCIHLSRKPNANSNRFTYSVKISIVNTSTPMIEWLNSHLVGYTHYKRLAHGNQRTTYQWNFTGTNRTIQLLSEIAPYLIAKRDQAELLSKGYKHLSDDDRHLLWQRMKDLKRQ